MMQLDNLFNECTIGFLNKYHSLSKCDENLLEFMSVTLDS